VNLRVALTADGEPARDDERCAIALTLRGGGLVVEIDAPFHGDPPPPGPPGSLDGLWNHEVVELFVARPTPGGWRYLELEFSPHGHFLALTFDGVRRRNPPSPRGALPFSATREGARWRGRAEVPGDWLPGGDTGGWSVNGNAIHGHSPRRYLTAARLRAPIGAPDFHRPHEFLVWAMGGEP
jgi:hypothetical protein